MHTVRPILIGFGTTFVFIMLLETFGGIFWPAPAGLNMQDPQAVLAARNAAPVIARLYVVVSYGIAVLLGAFLARKTAGGISTGPSWIVGGVFTAICGYNTISMHEPLWMQIASIAMPLPAAWAGLIAAAERVRVPAPLEG